MVIFKELGNALYDLTSYTPTGIEIVDKTVRFSSNSMLVPMPFQG